jgi:hypothetical protein
MLEYKEAESQENQPFISYTNLKLLCKILHKLVLYLDDLEYANHFCES